MFPKTQNDPAAADQSGVLTRLMARFAGDEQNYGLYDPAKTKFNADKNKLELGQGAARTQHDGLSAKHWEEHLAGTKVLGVIPNRADNTCQWGCIDSDIDIPTCLEVAARTRSPDSRRS